MNVVKEDGNEEQVHVGERSRTLKGGLNPAELGRKSGQARRERRAQAAEAAADVSHADMAGIVSALREKALKGDVPASRELREWLRQAREEGDRPADVLELLTKEQRAIFRGWLDENRKGPA